MGMGMGMTSGTALMIDFERSSILAIPRICTSLPGYFIVQTIPIEFFVSTFLSLQYFRPASEALSEEVRN